MLHIAVTMMQLAEEESLPGVVRKINSVQQSVWHSLTAHRLVFMGFLQEYASHLYEVFALKAHIYQRAKSFYSPSSFKWAANFSATTNAINLESFC